MYSKHDIDVQSIRHMPRSSVQRICDGVASIPHIPRTKQKREKPPVERLNPMRYKGRVEREAYACTMAGMRREVCSKDVLRLLDEQDNVPRNVYDDLINDVLEMCK